MSDRHRDSALCAGTAFLVSAGLPDSCDRDDGCQRCSRIAVRKIEVGGIEAPPLPGTAGHEDSFDDEEFRMVDHSGTLYTGGAWLLYREGLDCRIYYRNSIESIDPYGEHGGKRVKVWLSVKLQNRQDLEVLGYEAGNPDAADLLAEWLNPVPQKKVCRACGAPNDPGAKYCAWCGSPLD